MSKIDLTNHPDPDILNTNNVVSTTECTGLVQSLPGKDESVNAYTDIYNIPRQGNLGNLADEIAREELVKNTEEEIPE